MSLHVDIIAAQVGEWLDEVSFARVNPSAGMALGSSTAGASFAGTSTPGGATSCAPAAPTVTGCGAPVVRGGSSWKDEGRDVTRATGGSRLYQDA